MPSIACTVSRQPPTHREYVVAYLEICPGSLRGGLRGFVRGFCGQVVDTVSPEPLQAAQ